MGDDQTRVTLDFAGNREAHSLDGVPEVGDFITHEGELWVVQSVEEDDAGPVITCHVTTRKGARR
jgi:hypothetical protein